MSYGCAAFLATPLTGFLVTDVSGPIAYDPGPRDQSYTILGEVEGTARANSFLGIIATGDASIQSAYQDALSKMKEADAIIDLTIDYNGTSALGLVASFTTIIRGKAIKFLSPSITTTPEKPQKAEQISETSLTEKEIKLERQAPKMEKSEQTKIVGKVEPSIDMEAWRRTVRTQINTPETWKEWTKRFKKQGNRIIDDMEWCAKLNEDDFKGFQESKLSLHEWLVKKWRNE